MLVAVWISGAGVSLAATPLELANALDVSTPAAVSFTGFDGQAAVLSSLGSLFPHQGGTMVLLSSGDATNFPACDDQSWGSSGPNNVYDQVTLTLTINVPPGANSIRFDSYFMSREYPDFVGSSYNDSYRVLMDSPTWNGTNIVFDVAGNPLSVNSALFVVGCCPLGTCDFCPNNNCPYELTNCPLQGTGASCGNGGGGSGWLTTVAPVISGTTIDLTFEIHDEGDGIYDSSVLVDNIVFDSQTVPGPITGNPLRLRWMSPKTMDLAAGQPARIHGGPFVSDPASLAVEFNGITGSVTYIDETTLEIIPPPGIEPGYAQVRVRSGNAGGYLFNVFSYREATDELSVPVIERFEPEYVSELGGDEITITGSGFSRDSVVEIVGIGPVDSGTRFWTSEQISFFAPSLERLGVSQPFVVDIQVVNPGDLRTRPPYPLIYDNVTAPPPEQDEEGCQASYLERRTDWLAFVLLLGTLTAMARMRRRP